MRPTLFLFLAVLGAAPAVAAPEGSRAQTTEPTFQTGITGSASGGPSNPTTLMNDPAVRRLLLRLAEQAVPASEAKRDLAGEAFTLDDVVDAGLASLDGASVRLALNYVSAEDQRLIASKARAYGRELAELVMARRAEIEAAVTPLAPTEDERRVMLFFLVGCMALDWDGLGYTQAAGYRAGATVTGPGFAYTPWMKENAPDISRRGLYWGSHNRPTGDYTFTTFGDHDALPRAALPDLFFSLGNPFPALETPEDAIAARRFLGAYASPILADVANVLLAIHDGAPEPARIASGSGVAAPTVARILALLESIDYVRRTGDEFVLGITVLTSDAKPAAERIVALVRGAMETWHERRYAEVERELAELTALKRGVPFEVVYTEIWHYVFGYANRFLSESGLITDPYAEDSRFLGFVPFLWASSIDVSS